MSRLFISSVDGQVTTLQTYANPDTPYFALSNNGNANFTNINVSQNVNANNLNILYNIAANDVSAVNNVNANNLNVSQNVNANNLNILYNIAANDVSAVNNVNANNLNILYNGILGTLTVNQNTQLNNLNVTGTITGNFPGTTATAANLVVSNIPAGNGIVLGNFQGPFNGNCLCSLNFTIAGPVTSNVQSAAIALVITNTINLSDQSYAWVTGFVDSGTFPVPYQYQLFFPNMRTTSNYSLQTTTKGSLTYNETNSIMRLTITKLS